MKHEVITEKITGVFYGVYNGLGQGFLESVYEDAMAIALARRRAEGQQASAYSGMVQREEARDLKVDLLVEDAVLLELEAVRHLEKVHEAQTLHY